MLTCKGQYGFSYTTSGNINITSIQALSFTSSNTTAYFNTIDDYANGKVITNYGTLAVKSNVSWLLGISASASVFTPMSSGASTNMPASVMSFKLSSAQNYIPLSTNSQTLKTGSRGGTTSTGNSFSIDQKFNPGFGYKGGIYTLGVIYTLTQQ